MSLTKTLFTGLLLAVPALTQYGGAPTVSFWTKDPNGPVQNATPKGNVSSVEFLGNVTSTNTYSSRDCGFHGTVGKFQLNSYGDTSQCQVGSQKDNCWDGQQFVGSNTAALDTDNPLQVDDFNVTGNGAAQQFCPKMDIPMEQNNVFFAIGISNVVDLGNNTGIMYTSVNNRTMDPTTQASQDNFLGAGVAHVDASGDFPTCTRTEQYWWDAGTEPMWGVNSIVDGMDGKVYVFGSMNQGDWTKVYEVYIARVDKDQAFNMDAYEYWNGTAYDSARLINPDGSQAVIQGSPPSQIYWNEYLFCWMSITRDPTNMWGLNIQTAQNLHGPWSNMQHFYQETDLSPQPVSIYSPAAHPQFDPSGQTLVVTYAAWGPISAIKVTFTKD